MKVTRTEHGPAEAGVDAPGRVLFSEAEIVRRVAELGREIDAFYASGEELVVLGVLKGAFIFMADLVRNMTRPVRVDFLVAASYGADTTSSGDVKLLYEPQVPLEGRHVLLVEDIVDSGATLRRLVPVLAARGPASLEVCALLHKRAVTPEEEPRWVAFESPDEFVVGYGLDRGEEFRHLPFIRSL